MKDERAAASQALILGDAPLTIDDVWRVARGGVPVRLSEAPGFRARLERSVQVLSERLAAGHAVYGVTTGFGDSCGVTVPAELLTALPLALIRFHGCGTGAFFADEACTAILLARLQSLGLGYSAVRVEVLELLAQLVTEGVYPLIPEQGSVGASGDLTPLSYVAAVLIGERDVRWRGQRMAARAALSELGLVPLSLQPKESLALMNGTSVMTGLACLGFARARRLVCLGAALTALLARVLPADPRQFDDRSFAAKPHPGQRTCARLIREGLGPGLGEPPAPGSDGARGLGSTRIQDRYSVRCAPHILGVVADTLPWARRLIETELNGANDNPLVDPESGEVLHGGNFYGGHIAQVMDSLKTAVAGLADLFDRQLLVLCHPEASYGLPANLAPAAAQHGFKAVQIGTSALAAEAAKLCMPASVFSRSTENHNQDKVSMGTIAARDCLRILELTETAAVMHLLALCQAWDLREAQGATLGPAPRLYEAVRELSPVVRQDRALDQEIESVLAAYQAERLEFASVDFE